MPNPTISNNTAITTSIAITLCAGAFWSGGQFSSIKTKIENVQSKQKENEAESSAWRTDVTKILDELKEMTRDNKRRLDYEKQQN